MVKYILKKNDKYNIIKFNKYLIDKYISNLKVTKNYNSEEHLKLLNDLSKNSNINFNRNYSSCFFYDYNKLNYYNEVEKYSNEFPNKIPKIIHQIWIGPKKFLII